MHLLGFVAQNYRLFHFVGCFLIELVGFLTVFLIAAVSFLVLLFLDFFSHFLAQIILNERHFFVMLALVSQHYPYLRITFDLIHQVSFFVEWFEFQVTQGFLFAE